MNGKAPTLIALLSGYSMQEIRSDILLMCKEEPNLRIAIGTTVDEPTEILGYDITLNENRFKIMMAFYLIKIRKN